ncbi:MFS transporter [Nocardia sp. R6R-6]|uniref:MFS transporter n=1 Tax=Nocardia sp. R6R-6 TaxID=3459303 RepID=UPI00403D6C45
MNSLLSPRRQWRWWFVPLLCWLAMFVDGYEIFIYGATLPDIIGAAQWGVTTRSAAAVGSISLVGVLVGAFVAGTLTDILGRRKLYLLSLTLFSAAALGCAVAPNFGVFGAWRFVAGLGIGGIAPTVVAIAAEFAKPGYRSRAVGFVMTAPAVGGLAASFCALGLLEHTGFRPIYALGALPLLTLVPVALLWLPESAVFLRARGRGAEADAVTARFGLPNSAVEQADPSARSSAGSFPAGQLFENRDRWVTPGLWLMMFLIMMLVYGVTTWLPQLMVQAGFSLDAALAFFVLFSAATVVGTVLGAVVADSVGPKPVVVAGLLCSVIGYAVMALGSGVWLTIGIGIAGMGAGGAYGIIYDHIAAHYPVQIRATGLGWASGFGRFGAIIGPPYGGVFVALGGGNVAMAAWALALPGLLGAVLMSRLPRSVDSSVVIEPSVPH